MDFPLIHDPDPDDAPPVDDAARLILRLLCRKGRLHLHEAADALAEGFGARFLRLGANGPEPVPELARRVLEIGGRDVVWDAGDRLWRLRNNADVW